MGPITRQEKCFMRRMFTLNLNMYEEYKIKLKKKKNSEGNESAVNQLLS